VRNPLLTDISIDWGGLPVTDVYPARVPDLFSAKPVVLSGRYSRAASGTVRLRGKLAGREFAREMRVDLPASDARHDVLETLWARGRIDDLMGQDFYGMQQGRMRADLQESITQLGLDYRLMTQFTSFVAVEETMITEGSQPPRRVEVPVEMPEGVSYKGVFGGEAAPPSMMSQAAAASFARPTFAQKAAPTIAEKTVALRAAPSPRFENEMRPQPASKLDPALAAVVDRLKTKRAPSAAEARFVKNGKAQIMVRLRDTSAATMDRLGKLGFKLQARASDTELLIGELPVENLAALAGMEAVRYVAPQMSGR
jgi:Ca-activated chloride channel family protein